MPTRKKPPEEAIRYWKEMIAHMDAGWKKKKGMGYPWLGMDFRDLRALANRCEAWGVMALWDLYMEGSSFWGSKTGFMLSGLWKDIGVLLDSPRYKILASKYQHQFESKDALRPMGELLKDIGLTNTKRIA